MWPQILQGCAKKGKTLPNGKMMPVLQKFQDLSNPVDTIDELAPSSH
jgi:hypothetical protein